MIAEAQTYRPQPFDNDLETALLGSILVDPHAAGIVLADVTAEEFYDPLHQRIFAAIVKLSDAGSAVTPLTVCAALANDNGLKEVGGKDYLVSIARAAPALPPVRDYARILRELSIRREALTALENAADALATTAIPVPVALNGVMQINDHAIAALAGKRPLSLYEDSQELLRDVEDLLNGKRKLISVTTGLSVVDAKLGGLQAGDYVVIAGRPGSGKSATMTGLARAAAKSGRPCLVFSQEMTKRQCSRRILCDEDFDTRAPGERPLSYSRIRNGRLSWEEFERLVRASGNLKDLPLEIVAPGEVRNVHELIARARAFIAQQDTMGVIVIDYLQIIPATDRYSGSKVQEITEISNSLRTFAKHSQWPVVVGCQLSRETERRDNKRPMLSDLRESGAIEQDADVVIGLYRDAYYLEQREPSATAAEAEKNAWKAEHDAVKHNLDMLLLKVREGQPGSVTVFCDMGASAIRDCEPIQPELRGL